MKIDLTRSEYRDLLDMLYIADWVLTAHREEEDPRTQRYRKLEQKYFAFAKAMKYENLIESAPEFKEFFPNNAVEYFVSYYDYHRRI